jgi:hypothetical protein
LALLFLFLALLPILWRLAGLLRFAGATAFAQGKGANGLQLNWVIF